MTGQGCDKVPCGMANNSTAEAPIEATINPAAMPSRYQCDKPYTAAIPKPPPSAEIHFSRWLVVLDSTPNSATHTCHQLFTLAILYCTGLLGAVVPATPALMRHSTFCLCKKAAIIVTCTTRGKGDQTPAHKRHTVIRVNCTFVAQPKAPSRTHINRGKQPYAYRCSPFTTSNSPSVLATDSRGHRCRCYYVAHTARLR